MPVGDGMGGGLGGGEKPTARPDVLLDSLLSSDRAANNDLLVFFVTDSLFTLALRQEAGMIQAATAAG
jgi:hypothetical protein